MSQIRLREDVSAAPDTSVEDAVVKVRGICKTYGDVEALRNVDLDVARGKLTTLLGPSGCGKTTLLKIVAGLVPATRGEIRVNGKVVTARDRSAPSCSRTSR